MSGIYCEMFLIIKVMCDKQMILYGESTYLLSIRVPIQSCAISGMVCVLILQKMDFNGFTSFN